MHDYLRAIGFSNFKKKTSISKLLDIVMESPDREYSLQPNEDGIIFAEKSRNFVVNGGITVRGEVDGNGIFSYDYYFPHYRGRSISMKEIVTTQKLPDREDYEGICEACDQGMSMIFHLNRISDYSAENMEDTIDRYGNPISRICGTNVRLSALSVGGKVLIPLCRQREGIGPGRTRKEARSGTAGNEFLNPAADMVTGGSELQNYVRAERRLPAEDVFSIVDSYFKPSANGISYDQYSVLGDIIDCRTCRNQITGEMLYQMLVSTNGITVDVCINSMDLYGEPEPGRRFLGDIWLQGDVQV